MADARELELEKRLILDKCLNFIDEKKIEQASKQEIFEKLTTLKSYRMFEIAYENSNNKINAEKEMNLFIKQLGQTVLIKKVFVIIQFLTAVAKGKLLSILLILTVFQFILNSEKYEEMEEIYDKAIKLIALIETKDFVRSCFSTKYYDLVPIICKSDSFGKWELDPLFGHLKIVLILDDKREFPENWRLNEVNRKLKLFKMTNSICYIIFLL